MEKIKVAITDDLINTVLAQDVYNDAGNMIVGENTEITAHILKKLYEFKIDSVYIYSSQGFFDNMVYNQIQIEYDKDVSNVKELLQDLAAGKGLDIAKVEEVSSNILEKVNESTSLFECINKVRQADEYTYLHSVNVALYSMLLGKWLNFDSAQLMDIVTAGLLHDAGKAKIPPEILNKKGPLTVAEFEVMKKHTVLGYNLIKDIPQINSEVKKAVLMHHEKENGTGYPLGIKGNKKNLYSKIITIADIYDALTSERVYKERQTPFDAFRELERIGFDAVDPRIMMVFFTNLPNYYIGSKVVMETGEVGEVVYVPSQCAYAPVIKVNNNFVDVAKENSKIIKEFL
jgi:HD-GYP domain-containing protein (c-di-GMP phosphodiesterase class II)